MRKKTFIILASFFTPRKTAAYGVSLSLICLRLGGPNVCRTGQFSQQEREAEGGGKNDEGERHYIIYYCVSVPVHYREKKNNKKIREQNNSQAIEAAN